MTLRKSWLVAADSPEEGANALDGRLAQAGSYVRDTDGLVRAGVLGHRTSLAGTRADMALDIDWFEAVLTRGAGYGATPIANDGIVGVELPESPSSNSRWVRVYAVQHDNVDAADADNEPVLTYVAGNTAPSPGIPALPIGAMPIARVLQPANVLGTADCTVIEEFPMTSSGGIVPLRNIAERDAGFAWANGTEVLLLDTGMTLTRVNGGWVPSRPNKTGAYRPLSASNPFVNVGAFQSFPNGADSSALTRTFTKYGTSTRLHITMEATSQFIAGVGQRALLGLKLGSRATDEIARRYFAEGSGRQGYHSETFISGVPAGTFSCVPQFMMSPASSMTFYVNDDYVSWSIEEVA